MKQEQITVESTIVYRLPNKSIMDTKVISKHQKSTYEITVQSERNVQVSNKCFTRRLRSNSRFCTNRFWITGTGTGIDNCNMIISYLDIASNTHPPLLNFSNLTIVQVQRDTLHITSSLNRGYTIKRFDAVLPIIYQLYSLFTFDVLSLCFISIAT